MKSIVSSRISGCLFMCLLLTWAATPVGAASPSLAEAKKNAESKGYSFFVSHDEIVANARKEGALRINSGLETRTYKPLMDAFRQKYPFMTDIHIEEIAGREAYQRFILEVKAGQAKDWDMTHIPIDFAKDYIPYLKKHDIFGMARLGILKIDPRMVHPSERNIVSVTSAFSVVTYNRKLISDDKAPAQWEDFLKPEFKGNKFVLDLRPFVIAGLVPAWGLERTLDFARKLAAQQPVWGRTASRVNTSIATGENSIYVGSNFSAAKNSMSKDPAGNLSYKIIEPVPTRIIDLSSGILNTADHPNAALLWIEFLASAQGQEILDKYQPLGASVFTSGSITEQVTRGKKLSVVDWDHFAKFQEYNEKIFAAYGLPKADK